jgi:protein-S-isoprenylcysteine O-methyltransferase Ste14
MEDFNKTSPPKQSVHKILAHSYVAYLFFFLVGVCLDFVFNLGIFNNSFVVQIGVVSLVFGTFLVAWAQYTSRHLNKENITKDTFRHGPYRFTRMPTNFGLFFLTLGFGIIVNAFFVVLSSFISLIVAKFVFIEKQEKVLADKYGEPYLEYEKSVKF